MKGKKKGFGKPSEIEVYLFYELEVLVAALSESLPSSNEEETKDVKEMVSLGFRIDKEIKGVCNILEFSVEEGSLEEYLLKKTRLSKDLKKRIYGASKRFKRLHR